MYTRALDRLFRVRSLVGSIRKAFSPADLFTTGVNGVWYDPSDFSTLFQDAAGTTPVTAVEQPVGLMLDKSKGLVLGPELVPTTYSGTGSTGWTITTNAVTRNASIGNCQLTLTAPLVLGKFYYIQFTVADKSGDDFAIRAGSGSGDAQKITSNGLATFRVQAVGTGAVLWFGGWNGTQGTFTVTNISVRELPGNHAFQSTSANRPTLSARYNLLTKTEDFSNIAWANNPPINVTAGVTDPSGGNTAFTLKATANNAELYQTISGVILNTSHITSCWMRRRTGSGAISVYCNSAANPVTLTSAWQFITVSGNATATTIYSGFRIAAANDEIDVWHPDLRVSNDALNQPAYQRVNTSSDYDTVGFKPYLRFNDPAQGTNNWLQTNSIDFTNTAQMFVCAGVRKLSDSNTGILLETSAAFDTTNGVISVAAPVSSALKYAFTSRGSSSSGVSVTSAAYSAPVTNVVSCVSDLNGSPSDYARLRIDGTQIVESTTSQGSGTYGNQPAYIGCRAGNQYFFNGRLYQLVVAGKQASADEITNTRNYLEVKTFNKDMSYVYTNPLVDSSGNQITDSAGNIMYVNVNYQ